MAFSTVGTSYKTWCTLTEEAINSSRKIETILSNAAKVEGYNHTAFVQKYFDKHWKGMKMQLTVKGPSLPIMLVLSDVPLSKQPTSKKTSWRKRRLSLRTRPLIHSPSNI